MSSIRIEYDDQSTTTLDGETLALLVVSTDGYFHEGKGVAVIDFTMASERQVGLQIKPSDATLPPQTWTAHALLGQASPVVMTWTVDSGIASMSLWIPDQSTDVYTGTLVTGNKLVNITLKR